MTDDTDRRQEHGVKAIWHIDNVADACGWFTSDTTVNNGFGCCHPEQEEIDEEHLDTVRSRGVQGPPPFRHGRCHTFSCPLGCELNPSHEPDDAEEMRQLGEDPESMSDGEWMLVEVIDGILIGSILNSRTGED